MVHPEDQHRASAAEMVVRFPWLAFVAAVFGFVHSTQAQANPARAAMLDAFAQNCFSPFLTAETARANILPTGARLDFYDENPFSDVPPSTNDGRAVTPGTDRRCEVAFDGDHAVSAAEVAANAARAEGITSEAPVPASHAGRNATLLAARYLNPARVAVVTVGTRPGPNGVETYLQVERLTPDASQELAQ